jgi:hypothetical protein
MTTDRDAVSTMRKKSPTAHLGVLPSAGQAQALGTKRISTSSVNIRAPVLPTHAGQRGKGGRIDLLLERGDGAPAVQVRALTQRYMKRPTRSLSLFGASIPLEAAWKFGARAGDRHASWPMVSAVQSFTRPAPWAAYLRTHSLAML